MKFFSVLSSAALLTAPLLGAAKEAPVLDSSLVVPGTLDSSNEVGAHRHDIFNHVRIEVHGMKKNVHLTPSQINFVTEAFKRAFNTVHESRSDDYNLVDFNCTFISVEPDNPVEGSLLQNIVSDWLHMDTDDEFDDDEEYENGVGRYSRYSYKWWRVSRLAFWGTTDATCYLCANDDDSLALSDGLVGELPPFFDIKPVEDLFCHLLKTEGEKKVFGKVRACSIATTDFLESMDFDNSNENSEGADSDPTIFTSTESMLSITLDGLDCAGVGIDACSSDAMGKIVSDALVTAYNEVNFGDDLYLPHFSPSSFELVREQGGMITLLRGGNDVALEGSSNLLSIWKGPAKVSCRFCNSDLITLNIDEPTRADIAFDTLKKVEKEFCALMRSAGESKTSPAFASLKGCSLALSVPVTSDATMSASDI